MRLFAAALVLSLTAASAGDFSPATSPARMDVNHAIAARVAPGLYTMQERAEALQRYLHLAFLPTLGQPITLTPAAPAVPGVAELDFQSANVNTGNLYISWMRPVGEAAIVSLDTQPNSLDNGELTIAIRARAGQRYDFDCRAQPSPTPLTYFVAPANVSGTVQIESDGHFLIAVDKVAKDRTVTVSVRQITPFLKSSWFFYGCDISPF